MDPLVIFSGDGHIGQRYAGYRDYIDPEHRDRLDDLAETQGFFENIVFGAMGKLPDDVAQVVDERGVRNGMSEAFWDVHQRVAELDADGIAGEFAIADSSLAPFFSSLGESFPADVRAAGARAFNRWAAEFLSAAGGRIVGNAEGYPDDIARMVADLPRLAEQGFVSVTLPGANADESVPQLESPEYEPFWATCAELGMALNVHAGWGRRQGAGIAFFRQIDFTTTKNMMEAEADAAKESDDEPFQAFTRAGEKLDAKNPDSPLALSLHPQQAMWRVMLAGVFDRYPSLKLVLTEVRADWVPAMLAHLDQQFAERAVDCELKPSEYYARNCAVTPSAPHLAEVEILEQIGVPQFMFGADLPHPESTWPNTRQWIGDAFRDVPEDQLRMILGENAIRIYNLDRAPFDKAAARLGTTRSDVFTGEVLDDRLLENFDARAGYRRPIDELDTEQIDALLHPDLARQFNG